MATNDAPDLDPDTRRELERVAFSRPTNKKEAAAAAAAQAQLAAATPSPVEPTSVPEPVEGPDPDDSFTWEDEQPASAPRRRTLIPLLVIIGLVLGIGGGITIARLSPAVNSAASTPSPTPTHTPGVLANSTNAIAELQRPQSATDIFPDPNFATSLDLDKSSTHRILTTDDGITLWIGKSPQAICMLFTGGHEPDGATAGATCASIFEFGDTGLSLHYGHETWSWDGTAFTTTISANATQ